METAYVEDAARRYFGRMLGFPLNEDGAARYSEAVTHGCPPFLLGCAAVELLAKQGAFRAVAPDRSEEWLNKPLVALGSVNEYIVLLPGHAPADSADAIPIPPNANIYGAVRIPNRENLFGIRIEGRFVSWASAADMGGIYNITIETAPAHRKKGHARHALAALTSYLLGKGRPAVYLCEAGHYASAQTAVASGFYEYARLRRVIAE